MSKTIGMLGLGIMGTAMSRNLLDAGFTVVGYDVLDDKVAELAAMGGGGAASTSEVAQASEVIISVLPTMDAVIGSANEVAGAGREGQIFIECSTIPLDIKLAARDVLAPAGIAALDCPLSGTGPRR